MSLVRAAAYAVLLVAVGSPIAGIADDSQDGPKVRARLVAERSNPAPGESLLLGVHFVIDDGWHIYWRYPGDAGLATEIRWQLPEGWAAGPLLWPVPISFVQSGDLAGYGYEDEVVLASEVVIGAGALSENIGAEVSWLACRDVCVAGSAKLEAAVDEIPVEPTMGEWRTELPQPLPDGEPPFEWRTTGGFGDGRLNLWLRWPDSAPKVEWYPDPPEAIEVQDVRIGSRASLTRIDAAVRRRAGVKKIDTLSSLVVVAAADGSRRAWELELAVDD
ncbi:MAG: protein-disulfide reductase DsbD family protein [Acidobacteriota bacterium]|jgi:hypothetical protein